MIVELTELLEKYNIQEDEKLELISDLLVLFGVSNRDAGLPELKKFPLKNNIFQVWDTESDTALYQGTNKECDDFIDGFNGC